MFKVHNKNTRTTSMTFHIFCSVSTLDFEQVKLAGNRHLRNNHLFVVGSVAQTKPKKIGLLCLIQKL